MDFEEILEFEAELQVRHSDVSSAKELFKIVASDERKLKRLRSKLLALDVDVTHIDTAIANVTAKFNTATHGYKAAIAELYEFVGYDAYIRALDSGHKLACYARSVQLDKKKTGIGTVARGEGASVASNLYVISQADFKIMIKKKLKLLKKVRAKLSPIRYETVKTRNEWLILKLELRLLRRALNIASLRLGHRAPIKSACEFNARINYVIHNHITTEPEKNSRKFFYSERPYVETSFDVKPFTKQPLRGWRRKAAEADLIRCIVREKMEATPSHDHQTVKKFSGLGVKRQP